MGCFSSNGLSTNETNKNFKHEQNSNEIIKTGKKANNKFIIENSNLKEPNIKKEENNEIKKNKAEYRDEINLIYVTKSKGMCHIFGYDFYKENKNNIELIINGYPDELYTEYELEEGENNITLKIKKKIN